MNKRKCDDDDDDDDDDDEMTILSEVVTLQK